MSWVAVGVTAGTAIVGAYSSKQQAKAANKSKTTQTDQTTTQDPYRSDLYGPDIENVLNLQRGIAQRGAPHVNADGSITYDALPNAGAPPASAAAAPQKSAVGKGRYNKAGVWVPAARSASPGTPAGNGSAAAGPGAPAGPNLSTPQGIFQEVARRGLETGNTPTQAQARNVMANIWGASANPAGQGSVGAGEQTGFEGYNPVLSRLTGTLESDVNDRVGRDLVLQFLGEDRRGVGQGGPGSSAGGGNVGRNSLVARSSPLVTHTTTTAASGVPDTIYGDPHSFYSEQTQKLFNDQTNDAELQALIDSMNKDVERSTFRDLASLDAAAAGSGRFGGSTWSALNRDARSAAADEMAKNAAGVRVQDREARRQALLAAMQGVNTRDLGLLGANVNREQIAANERSAAAASAAASGANADQIALARRGQDLSALGSLLENERFSLGQLGDVGGQLSSDRLGSLGLVPGLEGIGLAGLNATLGAGGGLTDLRGQDIQRSIAGQQAAIARAGQAQQLGMFNAGQSQAAVNDYLRTILGIGGMGGTSHTSGTNVQPGLGVSPTGAAAMGALGGAATGAGIYLQGRQTGAW